MNLYIIIIFFITITLLLIIMSMKQKHKEELEQKDYRIRTFEVKELFENEKDDLMEKYIREKIESRSKKPNENNQLYIDTYLKGNKFPEYSIMENLGLEDYVYIRPKRAVKIMEDLIEKNPETKEEMHKIFEYISDEYRQYVFSRTKKIIDIVKPNKEMRLILMYSEKSLVQEAKELFESKDILIQFAKDELPGDRYSKCHNV